MKIGLVVPQFGINSTKQNLITFIQLAEKEKFESFWVYDRKLYPLNPQQPYLGTPDKREWPDYFQNVLDPLTTLAFIAANTSSAKLEIVLLICFFIIL